MSGGNLQYDKMVDRALKAVVREALTEAAGNGLPGAHHFYITFLTAAPGVDIPDYLSAQYPDQMTIVLQHQFWGLEVAEEHFEVTLSFNGASERLHIPFDAVTGFADPAVNFGLQFAGAEQNDEIEEPATLQDIDRSDAGAEPLSGTTAAEQETPTDSEDGDNVVALDAFRKK